MNLLVKIFVIIGSVSSIGFGMWHFFVPKVWNWYSFIDPKASELVVAVRAINVFFSLSLVLFGVINFLFMYGNHANRYSMIVILAATSLLWLTRVVFQLIYPQGSYDPVLQYGMFSAFVMITLCHLIPLLIIWLQ
jgi:hypothetical protein